MKKLILTSFIFLTITVNLLAGDDCKNKDYAYFNKSKPKIVLKSNNLQFLKYTDKNGDTTFTIINHDGTVLAEKMSRLELRKDFPEIEKKFKS